MGRSKRGEEPGSEVECEGIWKSEEIFTAGEQGMWVKQTVGELCHLEPQS